MSWVTVRQERGSGPEADGSGLRADVLAAVADEPGRVVHTGMQIMAPRAVAVNASGVWKTYGDGATAVQALRGVDPADAQRP